MSYRIAYAPAAAATRQALPSERRAALDQSLRRTVGSDPYGHGSTSISGDKDRRELALGEVIVVYYVSERVMTVTAVRLVTL